MSDRTFPRKRDKVRMRDTDCVSENKSVRNSALIYRRLLIVKRSEPNFVYGIL
jgi:hypothetical protein